MVNFMRFQWLDDETNLNRMVGFVYKYGDNIYEKLIEKLEEHGFKRGGSKKLFYVDFHEACTLIEDSDTLWNCFLEAGRGQGTPVRLETREKPRKSKRCNDSDNVCAAAPNEASVKAADSGAVATGETTTAARERREGGAQAIAKTRRRSSRRRARSRSGSRSRTRSHTRSRTRSHSRSRSLRGGRESRGATRSRSRTPSRSRSRSHRPERRSRRHEYHHRRAQHHGSARKHRASFRTPPSERRDLGTTSDSDYATGERYGTSLRAVGELVKRLEQTEAKMNKLISAAAPATR